MSAAGDALVERLARELAAFQRQERYGRHHIGVDMSLCGYRPGPDWLARPCSDRCQRVQAVLTEAAAHLGVTVDALRRPTPRGERANQAGLFEDGVA